ncbi:MAG TPA: ribosome maturation factor RimM [Steroidobacteraceae bacterium]
MKWIELGRIGAPFGVKGWTHVDSHTDPPEALLDYPKWVLRRGSGERMALALADGQLHGERLVARLEGIEDRDAAAALTGAVIEVERAELPPAGERQHYRADLIGLAVRNADGTALGSVAHFVDAPTGPVMVVRDADGREHWILAVPRYLRRVVLDEGVILVEWPIEREPQGGRGAD